MPSPLYTSSQGLLKKTLPSFMMSSRAWPVMPSEPLSLLNLLKLFQDVVIKWKKEAARLVLALWCLLSGFSTDLGSECTVFLVWAAAEAQDHLLLFLKRVLYLPEQQTHWLGGRSAADFAFTQLSRATATRKLEILRGGLLVTIATDADDFTKYTYTHIGHRKPAEVANAGRPLVAS